MNITYDEMIQLCESKQEFRAKVETVDGIDVTIFSYMVAMRDTFDSELAKEFRGTTFRNDTKECICRPFPKFFNLGERPDTQVENIDWDNASFYVKHDGSMATPVLLNGKVFWKTKNSFYSDVAEKIQAFWGRTIHECSNSSLEKVVLQKLKYNNFTPIFEYVAPHNQIVLEYEQEELKYLGFRNIDTGKFWPYAGTAATVTYGEIFDLEGVEGFVVHEGDNIFKMKTKWYLDRHKICTEFNPKFIIQSTLDNTIDDLIGAAAQLGLHDRQNQMADLRDEVYQNKITILNQITAEWGTLGFIEDQKEFALEVQNTLDKWLWPFMFSLRKDKDFSEILNKYVFNIVYDKLNLRS